MRGLSLVASLILAACAAPSLGMEAVVVEAIDGDTLRVVVDDLLEDVRLVGINGPELAECLGSEAAAALDSLLGSGTARLVVDRTDRDRYGRLLRLVFSETGLVNEHLVRRGWALAVPVPPDTSAAHLLSTSEIVAERAQAGMWAPDACGPTPPSGIGIEDVESGRSWTGEPVDGEWVVIANDGTQGVNLAGWTLRDASSSHRYRFPALTLPAGGRLTVRTACGHDRRSVVHWCSQTPIWNDDGDHALLLDPYGNIAAHLRY